MKTKLNKFKLIIIIIYFIIYIFSKLYKNECINFKIDVYTHLFKYILNQFPYYNYNYNYI